MWISQKLRSLVRRRTELRRYLLRMGRSKRVSGDEDLNYEQFQQKWTKERIFAVIELMD